MRVKTSPSQSQGQTFGERQDGEGGGEDEEGDIHFFMDVDAS